MGRQVKRAKAILAEEMQMCILNAILPVVRNHQRRFSWKFLFLLLLGARKCHSCKGEILRKKYPTLKKDFTFHMQTLQIWRSQKQKNGTNIMAASVLSLDHVMCTETQQRHAMNFILAL